MRWIGLSLLTGIVITSLSAQVSYGLPQKPDSAISKERCEKGEKDHGFAFIPEGTFASGSDQAERNYAYQISAQADASRPELIPQAEKELRERKWFDREPLRQIRTLAAFCLGRNLITNADYQSFVQATKRQPPGISEADYQRQGFLVHAYAEVKPYLWTGSRYPEGAARRPVVLVSYEDAVAFAQWQGQKDGHTYRLPTAEEWEKASRGTDGRYFPWGTPWRNDGTNWAGSKREQTSEVGAFPLSRSLYGVEDMTGNVFQYTSTLEQNQTVVVMKGCGWDDSPGFCRAAYRHTRPVQSRHILFGFRLLREE
jgi:toxoflavin biosynthesis protein ToxD